MQTSLALKYELLCFQHVLLIETATLGIISGQGPCHDTRSRMMPPGLERLPSGRCKFFAHGLHWNGAG